MEKLKKSYFFLFIAIFVFLSHQIFFQNFFPNNNLKLGADYSIFLPQFIFGKIWFNNNYLSIPWFSPSFCCGLPFFGDLQTQFYTLPQLLFIIFSPIFALKLMFLLFSLTGFIGTFLLMNKSFKSNQYISLIAASIFLFNGFFNYRAIIGHITYLNFIFVPIYCFLLIKSFESYENKKKNIFYILISALIYSHIIQSSGGPPGIIITMSILFVISLYIYFSEKLKIIYNLFFSFFIGLLISSSKIIASLHFLKNFQRDYTPIFFKNYYDLTINFFQSLFLFPSAKFNFDIVNSLPYKVQVHEIEFGITVVPLIMFAIFIGFIKKIKFKKISLIKFIALFAIFLLIFFVASINIIDSYFGIFFRSLPLIKHSWVNFRFIAILILPLIIVSSLMINKVFLKENTIKIFTILCLSIILFQNYIYDKSYYHKQNYNAKNIEILSDDKERIKNLKIENIVLIADKNKKPVITIQRNNLFIYKLSPMFCSQPIFGYKLEKMPKNFTFDKIKKIDDNFFYYTGDPKLIINERLNFFNPSCFIFPNENNCKPGDLFHKNQINELENFLNYKKFNFQISNIQKIFNIISILSVIFTFSYLLFYIYQKYLLKIKNKTL